LGQEIAINATPPITPEKMIPTTKALDTFAASIPNTMTPAVVAICVIKALR